MEKKNESLIKYEEMFERSIDPKTRESFWAEEAEQVFWFKKFSSDKILDCPNLPFYRWFSDGLTNICYNCVDRHIEAGRGQSIALIWESAYLNKSVEFTYNDLSKHINRLAQILINKGIKKGDTIIIYMPMIAESIFAMLACSRIGAIHSVVFGGFAAAELADRIKDANPKLLITASGGIEPRKTIHYYPIINEAIKLSELSGIQILLVQRENFLTVDTSEHVQHENTTIYQTELEKIDINTFVPCEKLESTHPLYILYTSGTTGSPKGIVRDTGGTCVALNYTMKNIMDVGPNDVVFSTSDIGWVVGHTFIVYGPLLRGATTIIFEGKPVGTPHCGVVWEIIEKYKVKAFYTAPTALRAVKREDFDYKVMKNYNLSSLQSIHMAGERCDPDTNIWLQKGVGEHVLVNDQWWQTESGWPICCNNIKIHRFKSIPGSACRPQPGYEVKILDENTHEELSKPNSLGKVCIKLPMPPSFMLTLWNNDQAFINKYISEDKKYYISGDCGFFDEEGYIHIMTRIDDMIKIAGHRLSTGRMEEVLTKIEEISEAAVVSVTDELKGELPFAFLICRNDVDISSDNIIKRICEHAKEQIVKEIGAISRLKGAIVCQRLPKTRSGKIIRSLLRNIINNEELKIPSTIEDLGVIQEIIELLKAQKLI
jgi:propionyl-CoA synthetase